MTPRLFNHNVKPQMVFMSSSSTTRSFASVQKLDLNVKFIIKILVSFVVSISEEAETPISYENHTRFWFIAKSQPKVACGLSL